MKNSLEILIDIKKLLAEDIGSAINEIIESNISSFEEYILSKPIGINLRLTNLDENIMAEIELITSIRLNCSRCLKEFDYDIKSSFTAMFSYEPKEEEFDINANGTIDLWPAVRQEIIVNNPMQPLCDKNCKIINYNTN